MAMRKDITTFLFGLIASILLFVVGGMFDSGSYFMGCYIFLGSVLTTYTILTFLIPSTKGSRDFVFSYAVSSACMCVISLITHIVITDAYTRPICSTTSNGCIKYIFISLFGFISSTCFLVSSLLSFKLAHIW
ncbi:conserved Plasmodium protein, unknown function [Plasmodium ovale]|uniref:MARVEL domain-containing protein n=1 Tax=Plasmodium ovale TaxID=36330 RepID=A0A1C3KS21_PLAOA|nr:conserved Plasmodium protein, unknown function [Plasmodium ovale]